MCLRVTLRVPVFKDEGEPTQKELAADKAVAIKAMKEKSEKEEKATQKREQKRIKAEKKVNEVAEQKRLDAEAAIDQMSAEADGRSPKETLGEKIKNAVTGKKAK